MARKIYECNNPQCGLGEVVPMLQFENEDHHCPECGCEMEINVIASMKGITADRVPGGYDSEVLAAQRNSKDGMMNEANFLAGESSSAY